MQPLWVLTAFVLGFLASRFRLPPLVGYLVAGFLLHALGARGGETVDKIADLGVILLLFSIGLKLSLRSLAKSVVWAGATLHMAVTVLVFSAILWVLARVGLWPTVRPNVHAMVLVGFALSFSSTVFAVKVFEERGETAALHSRTAIGVLIMQDLFAVLFLTVSTGKIPSPWAVLVVPALFVLRPTLQAVLDRVGHRELLLLFGVFLALGLGAGGFELVGLKADLGALVMGMLVAGHPKANELAKALLSFKDLFLVGFFLNIGLSGTPDAAALGVALLLTVLCVIKAAFFFLLFTRFHLRARTSFLASLSLANYSEFGLLVSAIGVKSGWLGTEWPIIIAVALSLTFILASPPNTAPHALFARFSRRLKKFESGRRHPDDQPVDVGEARVAVLGMGRVGTGAYDALSEIFGDTVLGIDVDPQVVHEHRAAGRNVIKNDGTDPDFWDNIQNAGRVKLVMLTLPEHAGNVYAAKRILATPYAGMIAASAMFDDQVAELEEMGVQAVFNIYAEAGSGFADHVCKQLPGRG